MNAIELARKVYRQTVDTMPPEYMPEGLRVALRSHERVPLFIDNLAKQFAKVPHASRETLEQATRDMTIFFINAAKTAKDQKMMSVMKKLDLKRMIEDQAKKECEAKAFEEKGAEYVTSEKGLEEIHTKQTVTDEDIKT